VSVILSTLLTLTGKLRLTRTTLALWAGYWGSLLPFYFIERSTWNYHYLGALPIGMLITASNADALLSSRLARFSPTFRIIFSGILLCVIVAVAWAFQFFAPWTYGFPLTPEEHDRRRWMPDW
jgi:dolichyl-phosphate-mannose--protein O-mannosyl transferase